MTLDASTLAVFAYSFDITIHQFLEFIFHPGDPHRGSVDLMPRFMMI